MRKQGWPEPERYKVGDKVYYRGRFTRFYSFPLRGEVEVERRDDKVGVRLENGNFAWAADDQLKRR